MLLDQSLMYNGSKRIEVKLIIEGSFESTRVMDGVKEVIQEGKWQGRTKGILWRNEWG